MNGVTLISIISIISISSSSITHTQTQSILTSHTCFALAASALRRALRVTPPPHPQHTAISTGATHPRTRGRR